MFFNDKLTLTMQRKQKKRHNGLIFTFGRHPPLSHKRRLNESQFEDVKSGIWPCTSFHGKDCSALGLRIFAHVSLSGFSAHSTFPIKKFKEGGRVSGRIANKDW